MSTRKKRKSVRESTSGGMLKDNKSKCEKEVTVTFIDDEECDEVAYGLKLRKDETQDGELNENTSDKNIKPEKSRKSSKKPNKKYVSSDESSEHSGSEKEETCEKPSNLFDEDDVAGEEMYSFRTPKKNQAMLLKARESASKSKSKLKPSRSRPSKTNTPVRSLSSGHKTPVSKSTVSLMSEKKRLATPKKSEDKVTVPKTPYALRARHKKDIQKHKRQYEVEEDSSDSDYNSSDGSGSDSDDESGSQSGNDSSIDSGKGSELSRSKPKCRRSLLPPPTTPSSKKRGRDVNYVVEAEEYFQSQGSKCCTSDNNLSRLRTPRLDTSELHKLLAQHAVSKQHQSVMADLRNKDMDMFQRWMFALSQGFSVLSYGLGSKYKILQNFHKEMLSDSHVLVVNGFFPNLSIKEVVDMIAGDLIGLRHPLPTPHAVLDWIESRRNAPRVFLIVHNLDAQMLRCEKTQGILSRLAGLPRVHLVASVDHINAPLLWDQAKLGNFNFMWEDVTSFLPYQEETSYENSLMVQNSGNLVLTSLLNVYRSLPNNSRGVFRIILENHLDSNNKKTAGMAFSELYSKCREEMLVTSDLALRTMLTEFLDHQMVKWRRDQEHLYIPTDTGVLRQFHHTLQQDS